MSNYMFEILPKGFRLATIEDLPLVDLTLAQAFADYNYPIPSIHVPYSALLKFYYEVCDKCAKNAIKNGVVLTNEDFSAVILVTPYEKRADYGIESLYINLKENAGIEAANNMKKIVNYICKGEEELHIDNDVAFIDMFAVQTPRQGQKLGSMLMRELFRQCKQKKMDIFLYTNTKKNESIYNHFGFETIKSIHNEELNSDTYYLLWKAE